MNAPQRCVRPREIRPGDLLAYAHGEAGAAVQRHVDGCSFCREAAESLADIQAQLTWRVYRRSCPPALTLGEYAAGLLSAADRQQTAAHLVACTRCLAESRDASRFLAGIDREEQLTAFGVIAAAERLLARLLRRESGLAMALRGSGSDAGATYIVEDTRLTISVQRATRGRGFVITGLLQEALGASAGDPIALYDAEQLVQSQTIDALSSFSFENVAAGAYRLELVRPAGVAVIEGIVAV